MRGSTSLLCFPFSDVRSMRVIASFRPQEMKIYPVSPIQRYCLLVSGRKNYGADMNVGACLYFPVDLRSEEHTSELQSLMRISYAVFCLKKKHDNHTKL